MSKSSSSSTTRLAIVIVLTASLAAWMLQSNFIPQYISDNSDRCEFVEVAKSRRVNDFRGACFVVLGGTDGIGKAMTRRLTREMNGKVLISGRTKAKLEAVNAEEKANVNYLGGVELSLLDPKSVARFAAVVRDEIVPKQCPGGKLGYLLLNAGMLYTTSHNETREVKWDDGNVYDGVFAANFLGDLALVSHLLPLLKASKTKVLIVSSNVYPMGDERMILNPSQAIYDPSRREEEMRAIYAGTRYKWGVFAVDRLLLIGKVDGANNLVRYGTSKLAVNALGFELLQKHGLEVVVGGPGAVVTGVNTARGIPREHQFKWYDGTGWPMLMTSAEAAVLVLDFLPFAEDEARRAAKGQVPHYFAPAYPMEKAPTDTIYDFILTWNLMEFAQRFTMREGWVWRCHAEPNVALPDTSLRKGMRAKYFTQKVLYSN